jgi:hypothetical protein
MTLSYFENSLSGYFIGMFMESAVKWGATNLTHLLLAEPEEGRADQVDAFLKANNSTLESLAIRQTGNLSWRRPGSPLPLPADALPRLKRLVVALDVGWSRTARYFASLESVKILELGAGEEDTVADVVTLLRSPSVWPTLQQLTVTVLGETEDWSELYELCEKKGVHLIPGFDVAADFPCTRP